MGSAGGVMRCVIGCAVGLSLLFAGTATAQEIRTLSNRADLISGGDALVEVSPAGATVDVDGRDVTSAFAVREDGRYEGVLTGLRDGDNTVTARAPGTDGAQLTIVNHPVGGPVIGGPQVHPAACTFQHVPAAPR